MSAEVQKQPARNEAPVVAMPIKAVRLVASALFNGTESEHIRMGPGQCIRYMPIRIDADGSPVAIGANQRADGFLFECERIDRVQNTKYREAVVVLNAGIRQIIY